MLQDVDAWGGCFHNILSYFIDLLLLCPKINERFRNWYFLRDRIVSQVGPIEAFIIRAFTRTYAACETFLGDGNQIAHPKPSSIRLLVNLDII